MDQCTPETIVVEEQKKTTEEEKTNREHPYDGWLPKYHCATGESATDDLDH